MSAETVIATQVTAHKLLCGNKDLSNMVPRANAMAYHCMSQIKLTISLLVLLTMAVASLFSNPLQFTIVALNLFGSNRNSRALDPVLKSRADILALVEWNGNPQLRAKLADYTFRVDLPQSGAGGIAILTRDISAHGSIITNPLSGPCAMPLASISFAVGDKEITIIAVHAPPPVRSCGRTNAETIAAIQDWISNGRLNRSIGSGTATDYLIISGDLNALPSSSAIRTFEQLGMVDTATHSNQVAKGTWSPFGIIPRLARIDYIFVPESFTIVEAKTIRIPGSDHRGVKAILQLP
jgi:endonuclease/exonuclease/phosphatase (EEP) superfamily protein YafD